MAQVLRQEFEERFKKMEEDLTNQVTNLSGYVEDLKEIITVREEQVMAFVKKREERIQELERETRQRDEIIKELRGNVGQNRKSLGEGTSKRLGSSRQKGDTTTTSAMEELFGSVAFEKYFTVMLKEENAKRKMCLFEVEKEIIAKRKGKPRSIASSGRNGFLVQVASEQQSLEIIKIKNLLTEECEVKRHEFLNGTRGIIYIHNNDVSDLESFQEGLRKRYPIASITRASWITPRNSQTMPFLIKIIGDSCPEYITVPGEFLMTKVYQYKDRPLQCHKCQQYRLVQNRCNTILCAANVQGNIPQTNAWLMGRSALIAQENISLTPRPARLGNENAKL